MSTSVKAIVLSKIKYRDNDLIVSCYTQHRGLSSYLIRGAFKSKRSGTIAYYQMLSQLEIVETYKPNQSLHYIKEVKSSFVYSTLHTNVIKSSIVLFLSEVLANVLKEEEQNTLLFDYLETALQWLDSETNYANFHLLFLLKLTKHLGFYPDTKQIEVGVFNLQTGYFEPSAQHIYSISQENNSILKQLLIINFDALNSVKLNANQRQAFLNMLMQYFELHLGYFRKPRSLEIFNEVFK
ncbi:DNA repair protein RecO [Bizionia argentinensis JUB59]|uniref:DNA repair protein RecO n=1 Tax=Bizionia argentinensis JUB59 TaxID=1046627 RepID=G2EH23_9FLAO|nr:DNA repair protein RecO [Bizionia argentinensis]EGV42283.1 DNA repair protein RecO [Bizionia argentinensis JUB59]